MKKKKNDDLNPFDRESHKKGCPMARALGSVAIECKHGYDCCPECDPCTCGLFSLTNDK